MGPFIADFYCERARLVIEIDGYCHTGQHDYDQRRTEWLRTHGVDVVRFPAQQVLANLDGVATTIARWTRERVERLEGDNAPSGLEDSATSPAQSGGEGV